MLSVIEVQEITIKNIKTPNGPKCFINIKKIISFYIINETKAISFFQTIFFPFVSEISFIEKFIIIYNTIIY